MLDHLEVCLKLLCSYEVCTKKTVTFTCQIKFSLISVQLVCLIRSVKYLPSSF